MQDKCPTCGKPSMELKENSYYPFCGERCRLIDLNNWLTEKNRIVADDGIGSEPLDRDPHKGSSKH